MTKVLQEDKRQRPDAPCYSIAAPLTDSPLEQSLLDGHVVVVSQWNRTLAISDVIPVPLAHSIERVVLFPSCSTTRLLPSSVQHQKTRGTTLGCPILKLPLPLSLSLGLCPEEEPVLDNRISSAKAGIRIRTEPSSADTRQQEEEVISGHSLPVDRGGEGGGGRGVPGSLLLLWRVTLGIASNEH